LPREAAVLRKRQRRRTGGLKIAPNLAGMKTKKIAARYLKATHQAAPYNQACGKRKFISDGAKCSALPAADPDSN
jgi:hypothetical protein